MSVTFLYFSLRDTKRIRASKINLSNLLGGLNLKKKNSFLVCLDHDMDFFFKTIQSIHKYKKTKRILKTQF